MRIANAGGCNTDEKQVEFIATVTGKTIKAIVSTKKQLFVLRNETWIFGGGCIIQSYEKSPVSELDIFTEYNRFGKGNDGYAFIMNPDRDGNIKVGFGSGALCGGLDKELTFKAVSPETYMKVVELEKEMMKPATNKWESEAKIREITGFDFLLNRQLTTGCNNRCTCSCRERTRR